MSTGVEILKQAPYLRFLSANAQNCHARLLALRIVAERSENFAEVAADAAVEPTKGDLHEYGDQLVKLLEILSLPADLRIAVNMGPLLLIAECIEFASLRVLFDMLDGFVPVFLYSSRWGGHSRQGTGANVLEMLADLQTDVLDAVYRKLSDISSEDADRLLQSAFAIRGDCNLPDLEEHENSIAITSLRKFLMEATTENVRSQFLVSLAETLVGEGLGGRALSVCIFFLSLTTPTPNNPMDKLQAHMIGKIVAKLGQHDKMRLYPRLQGLLWRVLHGWVEIAFSNCSDDAQQQTTLLLTQVCIVSQG